MGCPVKFKGSTIDSDLVDKALKKGKFKSDKDTFIRDTFSVVEKEGVDWLAWEEFVNDNIFNGGYEGDVKASQISTSEDLSAKAEVLANALNLKHYRYKANGKNQIALDDSSVSLMNNLKSEVLSKGGVISSQALKEYLTQARNIANAGAEIKTIQTLFKEVDPKLAKLDVRTGNMMDQVSRINPAMLRGNVRWKVSALLNQIKAADEITPSMQTDFYLQADEILSMHEDNTSKLIDKNKVGKDTVKAASSQAFSIIQRINPDKISDPVQREYARRLKSVKKEEMLNMPVELLQKFVKAVGVTLDQNYLPYAGVNLIEKINAWRRFERLKGKYADEFKELAKRVDAVKERDKIPLFDAMQRALFEYKEQNKTKIDLKMLRDYYSTEVKKDGRKLNKTLGDYSEANGVVSAMYWEDKGYDTTSLSLLFSEDLGKWIGEQMFSLPQLTIRAFNSYERAREFEKMSGITDYVNKAVVAEQKYRAFEEGFFKKFEDTKPNGYDFLDKRNDIELGAIMMLRNMPTNPEQQQSYFDTQMGLLKENTFNVNRIHGEGPKVQKIYEQVYEKFKDAKNVGDVNKMADPTLLEAAKYLEKEWAKLKSDLFTISREYYNEPLDDRLNYSPVKWRLFDVKSDAKIDESESFGYTDSSIDLSSEGVIKRTLNPTSIGAKKYIDLEAIGNNLRAMRKAILMVEATPQAHQMNGFLNSTHYEESFKDPEVGAIIKERVIHMQRQFRGSIFGARDSKRTRKLLSAITKVGKVAYAAELVGLSQPIKQWVPVFMDTLIATGGDVSIQDIMDASDPNSDLSRAIIRSGKATSIRNLSSEAIENKFAKESKDFDEAAGNLATLKSFVGDLGGKINAASEKGLQMALVNFDVNIAKTSWAAHYRHYLRNNNIEFNGWDAEINQDAADYAEQMVSISQNVSTSELMGLAFTSDKAAVKILVSTFMPFMNFATNSKARLINAVAILSDKSAPEADRKKAAKEVASIGVMMTTFAAVGVMLSMMFKALALGIAGVSDRDREEELERYFKVLIKGKATGFAKDLSPIPIFDEFTPILINRMYQIVTGSDDDILFEGRAEKPWERFGLYSLALKRGQYAIDGIDNLISGTGRSKNTFTGKTTDVSLNNKDSATLRMLGLLKLFYAIPVIPGVPVVPVEVRNVADGIEREIIKKNK